MEKMLDSTEITLLDRVFNNGGYVLDFTNEMFYNFLERDFAIYVSKNELFKDAPSKGKVLRVIWNKYPAEKCSMIAESLLSMAKAQSCSIGEDNENKVLEIVNKYKENQIFKPENYLTNYTNNEAYKKVEKDIHGNLEKEPQLCVDRVHTLASHVLCNLCNKYSVEIYKDNSKKDKLPVGILVSSLFSKAYSIGKFTKDYEDHHSKLIAEFFSKQYGDTRNKSSFAHANDSIMYKDDAMLYVKISMVYLEYLMKKLDF